MMDTVTRAGYRTISVGGAVMTVVTPTFAPAAWFTRVDRCAIRISHHLNRRMIRVRMGMSLAGIQRMTRQDDNQALKGET